LDHFIEWYKAPTWDAHSTSAGPLRDAVVAMPFVQMQLAAYQSENRRIKGMEEQPDPTVAAEVLAKLSSA
jgi:hypothetical protein